MLTFTMKMEQVYLAEWPQKQRLNSDNLPDWESAMIPFLFSATHRLQ